MEVKEIIRKIAVVSIFLFLITWTVSAATSKELEIQGKQLISQKPPFTLALPVQLQLMYSSALDNQRVGTFYVIRVHGRVGQLPEKTRLTSSFLHCFKPAQ